MQVNGFKDLVTIVGSFPNIQAGQTLQVQGSWYNHPKHGQQFNMTGYKESKPATLTGIEKYLGSGLIKGVGPVTAKRIVAHFGLDTLDIIEQEIGRLVEVPGIGKKRVQMIQSTWEEQRVIKDVMIFLQGHGVSTTYAVKIFKQYGHESISIVTDNPYKLAEDIFGIGFHTADKIAFKVGVSPWSKYRYKSGLLHILSEAAEDGHCFLPLPELVNSAIELLNYDEHQTDGEAVVKTAQDMTETEDLIVEQVGKMLLCYKPTFYYTEQNLAKLLLKQLENPINIDLPRVKDWIQRYNQSKRIKLSPQQLEAVIKAVSSRVMVLTGGPGTGKTFTQKLLWHCGRPWVKKLAWLLPPVGLLKDWVKWPDWRQKHSIVY
ncbi:RecD-like DNA helicase YrrC [Crocosphaera watsonii WH 0402]|uniref:RecD-like DNA helicase YrrC n=1 Tax=Crocosphaera watsonii WH 0402 TaxID=1284629 RepID=T2JKS9_CROWT|nr:RecD-like DNA helicase YrrC [Crocosphaera watsonii WH 0402]